LLRAYTRMVAETRTCPICENPVVVRVGIIERHPQSHGAKFARQHGRPPRVQWCEASEKRWGEVAKGR
jgi:hypothetical protein